MNLKVWIFMSSGYFGKKVAFKIKGDFFSRKDLLKDLVLFNPGFSHGKDLFACNIINNCTGHHVECPSGTEY